jgi:hypothetical protein
MCEKSTHVGWRRGLLFFRSCIGLSSISGIMQLLNSRLQKSDAYRPISNRLVEAATYLLFGSKSLVSKQQLQQWQSALLVGWSLTITHNLLTQSPCKVYFHALEEVLWKIYQVASNLIVLLLVQNVILKTITGLLYPQACFHFKI